MPNEYSLSEVARLTGVPYYRIYYSHYTGQIPEPRRVGRTRIYSEEDVQNIKEHFAIKEEHENAIRKI
jgi:DNA-binding transcriptional MerR regulator